MKASINIRVILKFRLELQQQNPNFDSKQQTAMPKENLGKQKLLSIDIFINIRESARLKQH